MDAQKLRERLKKGPILFDGATGTYAKSMSDWPDEAVERACLTAPERVLRLHQAYVHSGCEAVKTNTFAAHVGLAVANKEEQETLIASAVQCARQAGATFVFADIGPAPLEVEAEKAYRDMVDGFLKANVSCFLFETMHSAEGVAETATYIRKQCPQAFIAVSFAADPDGLTRSGELASSWIAQMDACEAVDAVGLNCICGAYHMRRLIQNLPTIKKMLIAMPNAGYPRVVDGRTYYDSDPLYYAGQVMACAKMGAMLIGGCCGTTPDHIRSLARMLRENHQVQITDVETTQGSEEKHCSSRIAQKLAQGKRVTLVELDPPRDSGIVGFLDGARMLTEHGADAVTLADCPIGRARMDSSLLACKLSRELGIEVLPHMTCRDRNVNATKALLLGLSMEGVHNVLAVTGDPVPTGERDAVKSVFQFNSRVLAKFVRGLSQTGETEPFFLCGALNINAVHFEHELARAVDKEACGVAAFLTQPVLSEKAARHIEEARRVLKGRIFGGLFPVVSQNNARFLQNEVAGIAVDDRVVQAYEGLNRAQGEEMAIRLCEQAAQRIAPYVDGFYIMTPFQRVALVCRVMERIQGL